MCGQDLSPRHRQELDEFNSNGGFWVTSIASTASLPKFARRSSLQNEQRQSQELEKQFLTLQRDQALLKQELSQQPTRKDWQTVKANRFIQVQSRLTEEKYLPDVRGQLAPKRATWQAAIDQDKHSQIRRGSGKCAAEKPGRNCRSPVRTSNCSQKSLKPASRNWNMRANRAGTGRKIP